jgi:hypothetical protein
MSRTDDLAAKAARLRAQQGRTTPAVQQVSTSVPTEVLSTTAQQVRTKPVRLTVDVSPADHAALNRLALEAAATIGVTRIHGQDIVRALIRRLLTDPGLHQAVITDIAATKRQ